MDGLGIKVKTIDGNETTYKLTPRVIVAFEQQYGKGMPKLLGEEQKIEHVFYYQLLDPIKTIFDDKVDTEIFNEQKNFYIFTRNSFDSSSSRY